MTELPLTSSQTILSPFFEENDKRDLIVPALITVPPVAVECFGEDVFLTALNLGATFGVTLLFLVIPAPLLGFSSGQLSQQTGPTP